MILPGEFSPAIGYVKRCTMGLPWDIPSETLVSSKHGWLSKTEVSSWENCLRNKQMYPLVN